MHSNGKRIVLVGSGHVHATMLQSAPEWLKGGCRVTLISPGPFIYSGMATGVLSGDYSLRANYVDLKARADAMGIDCVSDRMIGIASDERRVLLESGKAVSFDALSLNLGSRQANGSFHSNPLDGVYGVKPLDQISRLRVALEEDSSIEKVAVVGAGATGVEVACCLAGLARRLERKVALAIIAPHGPLREWPEIGRSLARKALGRAGVKMIEGARATDIRTGRIGLDDGEQIFADAVVSAIGVEPATGGLPEELALGVRGGMAVDEFMQSRAADGIFGGGDLVDTEPPLDRIGVYAVREAKTIARNIGAYLEGRPMEAYQPQKRYAQILNLGDRTGLLRWGPLALRSRWAFSLKDRIDRNFIKSCSQAS